MKHKTKDQIFYKLNNISYIECTIVGYTLFEGKTTYRLFDPIKEELFDGEEDKILNANNFKILNDVLN